MGSTRNGGLEMKLQKAAASIGLISKNKKETTGKQSSDNESDLEEKILKPSSPVAHRERRRNMVMVPPTVGHGLVKYRWKGNQRARRLRADIFHFLEGCRTAYSAIYHGLV